MLNAHSPTSKISDYALLNEAKKVLCELLVRDTVSGFTASEGVLDHSARQSLTMQDDFHCAPTKLLDLPEIPHELMLAFAYGTAIYVMSK